MSEMAMLRQSSDSENISREVWGHFDSGSVAIPIVANERNRVIVGGSLGRGAGRGNPILAPPPPGMVKGAHYEKPIRKVSGQDARPRFGDGLHAICSRTTLQASKRHRRSQAGSDR